MPGCASHPLDALSADEITAAAAACRALASAEGWGELRFNVVTLQEPPKAQLLAYDSGVGPAPPRRAFAVLQTPPSSSVVEVMLAILIQPDGAITAKVTSWQALEGVQPLASPDDCLEAEAIAKADQQVVSMLSARGITDMSLVACDPWSVHAPPCSGRLIQLFMYARSSPDSNAYARPLDFTPIVDLHLRTVVRIDARPGEQPGAPPPPVPAIDADYHSKLFPGPWRNDIKPLDVTQPEGPSFTVEGSLVKWQRWQLRVGFNHREGLVLHSIGYEDGGRVRPVVHRLSLVEMAVPYADPREPFVRKCAFDVGDYGLGYCTLPLTLGCDCLGHIHYFDAVLPNSKGEPQTIPNAICMHEEDAGLLWKHVEYRNGHSESRRSRRLVISFVATVVNYEYGIYVSFYQDGGIGYEIKLTGELSTNQLAADEDSTRPSHGTLVLPGVNAQHHQHMFCARIDPAVDDCAGGRGLVVCEVDAVPMPRGPGNPYGNAFVAQETDLTSTSAAQRDTAPECARIWKIKNPAVLNPMSGAPVAYKLVPLGGRPALLAAPDSLVGRRAVFARHALWVTPHDDAQRFPAGEHVMMASDCTGLAVWTKEDKSLINADPVIYHSFGVTHIVRVEDFPVMPVEVTGFSLKPYGFFSANPAVDIPPAKNMASTQHAANGTATATNGRSACCKDVAA